MVVLTVSDVATKHIAIPATHFEGALDSVCLVARHADCSASGLVSDVTRGACAGAGATVLGVTGFLIFMVFEAFLQVYLIQNDA